MADFSELLPQSFESWKHCITVKCGITLTPEYVDQRIEELTDNNNTYTSQFKKLYGDDHWRNVLGWFQQARMSNLHL